MNLIARKSQLLKVILMVGIKSNPERLNKGNFKGIRIVNKLEAFVINDAGSRFIIFLFLCPHLQWKVRPKLNRQFKRSTRASVKQQSSYSSWLELMQWDPYPSKQQSRETLWSLPLQPHWSINFVEYSDIISWWNCGWTHGYHCIQDHGRQISLTRYEWWLPDLMATHRPSPDLSWWKLEVKDS